MTRVAQVCSGITIQKFSAFCTLVLPACLLVVEINNWNTGPVCIGLTHVNSLLFPSFAFCKTHYSVVGSKLNT